MCLWECSEESSCIQVDQELQTSRVSTSIPLSMLETEVGVCKCEGKRSTDV